MVTPKNIFEAAKGVFIANGIKEFSRYIQAPPQDVITMTPEEEVARLLRVGRNHVGRDGRIDAGGGVGKRDRGRGH